MSCPRASQSKLKSEAVTVGLLQSQVGNPEVSIIAIETVNGKVFRELTGPLNNMLKGAFVETGITPTDMQQAMNILKTTEPDRWAEASRLMEKVRDPLEKEFDVQAFGRLGWKAGLIVVGMINSTSLGKDTDGVYDRFECTATLRIFDANTAHIYGTVTASETSRADNPKTALINVCNKLLPAARELIPQTLRKWQDMAINGMEISLTAVGFPTPQIGSEFRDGLETIQRVNKVVLGIQKRNFLEAEVIFKGETSGLVEAIEHFLKGNFKNWEGAADYGYVVETQGNKVTVS